MSFDAKNILIPLYLMVNITELYIMETRISVDHSKVICNDDLSTFVYKKHLQIFLVGQGN